MRMAKASEADLKMALTLAGYLGDIERGHMPDDLSYGGEITEFLDSDDCDQYARLLYGLRTLLDQGSICRVIWGMYVLCDPANRCIDPDSDTLEDHPDTVSANKDAERYRWLRDRLMGADSTGGESGECALMFSWPKDSPVSSNCDKSIDDAIEKSTKEEGKA